MDKSPSGSVTRTTVYYPAAGAMRVNGTLYYMLKDHLGSASVVTDASGNVVGENRYYPYGETRYSTGSMYTDKLFTGQREVTGLGIYHYQARFYLPHLGRFLSPDTIIPVFENPQSWNRFSYAVNNPIRYNDPDGHCAPACTLPVIFAVVGLTILTEATIYYVRETPQGQQLKRQADAAISRTADQVSQYISANWTNRVRQFEQKVADTNNGKNFPRLPLYLLITLGVYFIHQKMTDGGCGEPESLSECPDPTLSPTTSPTLTTTPTLTPTPTPAPTSTSTPTPIQTPISTPSSSNSQHPFILPDPSNQFSAIPI